MKHLLLIATMATLATAKPGLYKEKEDFQYSRSSTDEGSKAGFYGAQRGNMGGNYERAHNMDGLAQNQMSGLVKQVEGELGDGSKTRTGSVFTAANSRGVYGSSHYNPDNLQGRNFQEGVSYDDAQSHSSLTAQSGYNSHSSGYNAHSSGYNAHTSGYNAQSSALNGAAYTNRHSHGSRAQSGYGSDQYSGHNGVESNLQQAENLHAANEYGYGGQEATGYLSQSTYNGQSAYDQSRSNLDTANFYGSNAQTRLASRPVKVILRPGTRVTVPIATQTYDSSNSAAYNHNSVNTDAELLNNQNQYNSNYKPTGAKHYESSYSYRKEWEKHDTQPVTVLPLAVPTANPISKNSELYEDAQSLSSGQLYQSTGAGSQRSQSHSSNSYGGYNANVNSASSSQSHHQSAYNAQHHRSTSEAASDSNASSQGTYNSGVGVDTTNQIEDLNSNPKSYHSSYSYHKSWERQGDPYVIKPASSGYDTQAAQRLTAASNNQGTWSSHRYGSRYQQAHQNVLKSEDCDENGHIRLARSYNTNQYEEQQNQYNSDQEVFQSQNLEDLTLTQNKWDKVEDLGQQTQNKWDKIEDLGQQTQNKWDKIEDLGQQTQNKWDQSDLVQQTQNKWDKLEDVGQQTQNQWDKLDDMGQQSQLDDGQQLQNTWSQLETSGYHGVGQETQTNWDNINIPKEGVVPESVMSNNKPTQHPVDTSSHKLPIGIGPIPSREQNENNKKPLFPNIETEASNIFNSHVSTSPKEQPVQSSTVKIEEIPDRSQNPFNSYNIHLEQSDNSNLPTPGYNNFNHPWFNQFANKPQSSEQIQNSYYYNQQSHMHNGSQPQNAWDEFSINHHHTGDKPSNSAQDTSKLWNLWEKVDTIEKQTISSNKNSTEESQHSYYSQSKPTTGNDDGIPASIQNKPFLHHQFGHNIWEPKEFILETTPSTTTSTTKRVETSTFATTSTTVNNKPQNGRSPPSDVGRGDIEPEDSVSDNTFQSDTQEKLNEFGTQQKPDVFVLTPEHKPYKTPAEIEALSQVILDDKTTTDSTVNFKEGSFIVNTHEQPKHKLSVVSSTTSRAIIGLNERNVHYQNMDQFIGNTVTVDSGKSTSFGQSNLEQSVNSFGQQSENDMKDNIQQEFTTLQTDSHRLNGISPILPKAESYGFGTVSVQSTTVNNESISERPLLHPLQENRDTPVNINKFWDKLDNSNTQMPEYRWFQSQYSGQAQNSNYTNQKPHTYNEQELNIGQQSEKFDQQNTEQQFETFGQESENFGQLNENFGQVNDNFGQQSEKFDQHNTEQQFENFGQQSEPFGQESENFGQLNENFGQINDNFGQQSEKFDQHNTEQQFENFGQQSQNFGQQSENFGQQSENFGQQSENFGQQSENFGQLNENFGQINENFGQQSEKFHQQNTEQQFEHFGQQSENFEQLNENFGQQSENLDQNTDQQFESFYQQVGNEQQPMEQPFETFGQQVDKLNTHNSEQEPIHLVTQKENKNNVEMINQNFINSDQQQREQKHKNQNVSPVESVQNIGTISGRSFHSTYKEQQNDTRNNSEDLVQQYQAGWDQHENVIEKANVQETQNLQVIPVEKPVGKIEIPEDRAIKIQTVESKDLTPTSTSADTPPETEKDKPGFWKSVENKFVNAKDKVFSWFSSG